MTLPELAISRRVTTMMVIISLIVLGGVALVRLPLAFMPEFVEPQLFVRLPYPTASPDQVERMIVRPVEEVLGSVKGLKNMWSFCDQTGGMVGLEFDWSVDMQHARVEVLEKLDRVRRELPDDLGDIIVSNSWDARGADKPILEGRLSSPRNLSESYDLLDRKIVRPLSRIPGVAQVRLDGVQPREVRVNLRMGDLEHHGVDVRDVARVLAASNFDRSLGKITDGDHRFALRVVGTFGSIEEIEKLPIRKDGLRLRNVADVVFEEPPLEYGRHLDGNFAIGISVSQEAQANTVEVCRELKARIEAMREDAELEGVDFLVWFSQGKEIEETLGDLAFTGAFGAILASLVLFGFLRRSGTTLICVSCIPFSLLVTCGVIWAQGKSLNTLTLLGLIVGVGMLVDNAVVVMENIFRHAEQGSDRLTAAREGSKEVSTAVIAATLTSVIVFLPLIFNKPSEINIILGELGITVCLTLLASLFISQTFIPLATAWFVRSEPRPRGRILLALEVRYRRLLELNLHHRWITPLTALVIMGSAVYPFLNVDMNFDTNQNDLFVQVHYKIGGEMSLEKKEALVTQVEQVLMPHKEELMARSIYSFWSDQATLTRVYLREGLADEANMVEVKRRLEGLLPVIPGAALEIVDDRQFWRQDRGKRVAFQIVGEDSGVLSRLADEARQRLEAAPGLRDSFSSTQQGTRELHVALDRDLMNRYEVSAEQPAEVVGLTYRGRRLKRYRTPDGEKEMRLTLDERKTESIAQLRNLPIYDGTGARIPLAAMAEFKDVPGPGDIQRDNRLTSVWVGAAYEEGTKEEHTETVREVMAGMTFPYGYSWTFGRWQQRQEEQSREFMVNLALALLLIFAVMAGLFESIRQAIALMIALPFALSGAVWTLWITDTDFDQPAAVGVLLLIGIVVNNGIVMIEHINTYRRRGVPREQALLEGGRERLRPILMTAVTTLIGLLPIVIQKPSLAGVYYYSMALVIMGGLLVSTFLTTVLLPTTVTLVEDFSDFLLRVGRKIVRRNPPVQIEDAAPR